MSVRASQRAADYQRHDDGAERRAALSALIAKRKQLIEGFQRRVVRSDDEAEIDGLNACILNYLAYNAKDRRELAGLPREVPEHSYHYYGDGGTGSAAARVARGIPTARLPRELSGHEPLENGRSQQRMHASSYARRAGGDADSDAPYAQLRLHDHHIASQSLARYDDDDDAMWGDDAAHDGPALPPPGGDLPALHGGLPPRHASRYGSRYGV
jgi:hypothetical protein